MDIHLDDGEETTLRLSWDNRPNGFVLSISSEGFVGAYDKYGDLRWVEVYASLTKAQAAALISELAELLSYEPEEDQ